MPLDAGYHLREPVERDHAGVDGLASRRHLVEPADVHLAVFGQRQSARDRGGGHRQCVRRDTALLGQQEPLAHPEAMLLVDHDQAEVLVAHALLEDRMGPDDDLDRAVVEPHQDAFARPAFVAPGKQRDLGAGRRGEPAQGVVMLPRQQLGRREQGSLRAGFDRNQHRFQRDHRLARADVALQQAQHRRGLGHVALDLADRATLGAGEAERQLELAAQRPVTLQRLPAPGAVALSHQHQRQAVRQQFVVGEPVARGGVLVTVAQHQRVAPGRPPLAFGKTGLDPLGQLGHFRQRLRDQLRHDRLGQPFGEAIDRLVKLGGQPAAVVRDMVRVDDLEHVPITVEPPRHPALFAHRQQLLRGVRGAAEISQRADVAEHVLSEHPVRPAIARFAMFDGGQGDDDLLADARLVEVRHRRAGNEPLR